MPRFFCPCSLFTGETLELPAGAARHVQVLRLQPGDTITLFNGDGDQGRPGGEFTATITRMGRSDVQVQVGDHHPIERQIGCHVHLAVGVPANDRMDWLIEKATELGVASVQPLMTERSVLRLDGARAAKKLAHWQSIAVAACEQCGGNQVPRIHPLTNLTEWFAGMSVDATMSHWLLSLRDTSMPLAHRMQSSVAPGVTLLSGPEGGLSRAEESAAIGRGMQAVNLGPRVLRAETAALAALSVIGAARPAYPP